MLTEKPWRLEAIIRLLAGMLTCVFLGSLLLTIPRFDPATGKSPAAFYSLAGGAMLLFGSTLWLVARPWKLEEFKLRAGLLLICAYGGLALSGTAQHIAGSVSQKITLLAMVIGALAFQGASIPLMWLLVRQHGLGVVEGFGLNTNKRHALLLGATVAFAFLPVALGMQYGIGSAAEALKIKLPLQDAVMVLQLTESWPDRIVFGLVVVVLAPVAEEGLFRGILFPGIKALGYPRVALWVTSVVFALIHFNTLNLLPLLALAIVLAKLYERTGNLLSCIACHATFNLFNFVMLLVNSQISSGPWAPQ